MCEAGGHSPLLLQRQPSLPPQTSLAPKQLNLISVFCPGPPETLTLGPHPSFGAFSTSPLVPLLLNTRTHLVTYTHTGHAHKCALSHCPVQLDGQ